MKTEKIIGYILLSPALISVVLFFYQLFSKEGTCIQFHDTIWTGGYGYTEGGGGGYTSALPFYFGLMAIAGVYLIKDSKTKEETAVKHEKKEG